MAVPLDHFCDGETSATDKGLKKKMENFWEYLNENMENLYMKQGFMIRFDSLCIFVLCGSDPAQNKC